MNETAHYIRLPSLIRTSDKRNWLRITDVLRPESIISFVGGGGKTSTMLAMAYELSEIPAKVIVTTSTHMLPLRGMVPENVSLAGVARSDGKIGPVKNIADLKKECDFLLIEADGSRRLPSKAPADYEPVIIPETEMIIAVQGLSACGHPIKDVCHRYEIACEILNKQPEDTMTEKDCALLLTSENGQFRNVGDRKYAVVLNQADTSKEIKSAEKISSYISPGITCLITSYKRKARSGPSGSF